MNSTGMQTQLSDSSIRPAFRASTNDAKRKEFPELLAERCLKQAIEN